MTTHEYIALAQAYVALSNAHRIDRIATFFDETSRYHSGAVGEFQGVTQITNMMSGFFARYPDVHWNAEDYQCASTTVSFSFRLHASDSETGQTLERSGRESIEFDSEGIIRQLTVETA